MNLVKQNLILALLLSLPLGLLNAGDTKPDKVWLGPYEKALKAHHSTDKAVELGTALLEYDRSNT